MNAECRMQNAEKNKETRQILIAGFGGQGILFTGKFLAYQGLTQGKQVSWLPSYGPEMRGGTASCGVILSDAPVGSPIVSKPDVLVAMNLPSLDRYESAVAPGGLLLFDSSLIGRQAERTDLNVFAVPATRLASDNEMPTLANMVMMGKLLSVWGEFDEESVKATLKKVISAKHEKMLEFNLKAMKIGAEK